MTCPCTAHVCPNLVESPDQLCDTCQVDSDLNGDCSLPYKEPVETAPVRAVNTEKETNAALESAAEGLSIL